MASKKKKVVLDGEIIGSMDITIKERKESKKLISKLVETIHKKD